MTAVLFISHGSKIVKAKKEAERLVKILQKRSGIPIFKAAFLEIEWPSIPRGIDQCVKKGADEVILLLNFFSKGRHVDWDIPKIVREARRKYPGIKFQITQPVGRHPGIKEIFLEMIRNVCIFSFISIYFELF